MAKAKNDTCPNCKRPFEVAQKPVRADKASICNVVSLTEDEHEAVRLAMQEIAAAMRFAEDSDKRSK